jgi:hypothetical protein
VSVQEELIASGVTLEMLVEVLQAMISYELAHPTKAYKWYEYAYFSIVSQRISKACFKQKFEDSRKGELKVGDTKEVDVFDPLNYRYGKWMKKLMSNHTTCKFSGDRAIGVLVELIICWKTSIVAEKYGFITSSETGEEGLLEPAENQRLAFDEVKSMVDNNKLFKSVTCISTGA